ncbi:uncharacterized protein LOC126703223 [Quercus robur]|uniref:uncharacterized protein LOC126703223 n=1 Tax=Quercus robur TaxID=38942 RepID=UPI0021639E24|nr:uncharacterized protein LOC126703223 [Quercus robur]
MDLQPRTGLRGLLSNRSKGQTSKEVSKGQTVPKAPVPPPPPSSDTALQPVPNLRRKRPVEETEEGEVSREKAGPKKKGKETKEPREKRTRSTESRDEAAIPRVPRTWSPRIELDGAPVLWDATLWESQREQASFLAEALQQPLLLPRDMEGLRKIRQPELFMSLKRDMAVVTQQIYIAEEWAKKAREDMHKEAQSRSAAERAAGDLKRDFDRQGNELKEVKKANASAEAGLKNAEKQADELRKQLRHSEERLAAEQQAVSELKAELARTKEETRLSREVAEKAVAVSYERGVHDTEERLAEEVATVCREYVTSTWGVAIDRAAVPADSDLRKAENIFFPAEIREIPGEVASTEPLPANSSVPETRGTKQATQGQSPEDSLRISEILAQAQEIAPENPAANDQPAPTQGP